MDGAGVSTVRYAGSSSLAAGSSVKTYTLAAQSMVAGTENSGGGYWGGDLCNGNPCDKFNAGTAPAVNFSFTTSWNASTATGSVATAQDVVNAGGFVFVSKSGSTWQVANNQNGADVTGKIIALENDDDVKRARSQRTQGAIFSCGLSRCEILSVRASPDITAIQARADAIYANDPNDS